MISSHKSLNLVLQKFIILQRFTLIRTILFSYNIKYIDKFNIFTFIKNLSCGVYTLFYYNL